MPHPPTHCVITNEDAPHDRYDPAPLRNLSLCGEGPAWPRTQGPGLGIGRNSGNHAQTRPDGPNRRLPQDGGLSPDGSKWIACRPRYFLTVEVLSALFRRLFLQMLVAAHQADRLQFFADQPPLTGKAA